MRIEKRFFVLIILESFILFFASTFLAHLMMQFMKGDKTQLLTGTASVSKEAEENIRAILGDKGIFHSYFHALKSNTKALMGYQNQENTILLHAVVTIKTSLMGLFIYLVLSILFNANKIRSNVLGKAESFLIMCLMSLSLFPVFALSRIAFQFNESIYSKPLNEIRANHFGDYIILYAVWAMILAVGDGGFLEGQNSFRREIERVRSQSHMQYIYINNSNYFFHFLKNILPFTISIGYYKFINLIGGTVILEYIFNIKGLGWLTVQSVFSRNYDDLLGITFLTMLIVSTLNLLHKVSLKVIDPRYKLI